MTSRTIRTGADLISFQAWLGNMPYPYTISVNRGLPNQTRAATMHMDGVEWVEKSAYDTAMASLQEKQRSQASHNRYFAHIIDMFHNLPDSHAQAPYAASPEAFRKHGLIEGGYCDTDTLAMPTPEAALEAAPFVAKLARKAHGYAVTVVRGSLIVCTTPHSQSFKAMGKDKFHASVAACEEWAERLLAERGVVLEGGV